MGNKTLITLPEHLVKQWHPTKNTLSAESVTAGSHKKVWWVCDHGHEWDAVIKARVNGNGCPYCSGRRVVPGVNDLATINPELATQWHPTKNGSTTAQDVTSKTLKKVWWKANCGHEWEAVIGYRSGKLACPVCLGSICQSGVNDLATKRPEIAALFHPTKNGTLTAETITSSSNKKVWWKCEGGHEWQAHVNTVKHCPQCYIEVPYAKQLFSTHAHLKALWNAEVNTRTPDVLTAQSFYNAFWMCEQGHEWKRKVNEQVISKGCPFCLGYRLITGFNDLETLHPELAAQWHPSNNEDTTPSTILPSSTVNASWVCDKGHEWKARINNRVQRGFGCPVCSGKIVEPGKTDLATKFKEIAGQWHPTKNNSLTPTQIHASSGKRVWWQCDKGHEWQAIIASRTNGNLGCPYCANRKLLKGFNDLATSFPEIALQFHPEKNKNLTPDALIGGSNKKVWWLGACGHEWEMSIVARTYKKMNCPLCSGRRVASGVNDLSTKFPGIAAQWHKTKNGDLSPTQLTSQSNKKVWWMCEEGHEWKVSVQTRTTGRGCPVCSNKKVLTTFNDLATTNLHVAQQWHPTKNTDLQPSMVTAGSSKKVWWQCENGHEWEATVSDRNRGIGCQRCVSSTKSSRGERALISWIESLHVNIESNVRNVINKELDLYLPEHKIAIEYNGLYWHSEATGKHRDYHHDKWLACKEKGIQLIQIWEDEWLHKSEIVKSMLAHKLGLSSLPKIAGRKTEIREVTTEVATRFLNAHHIQGFASASKYIALTVPSAVLNTSVQEIEMPAEDLIATPPINILNNSNQRAEKHTVVALLALRIEKKFSTTDKRKEPRVVNSGNIIRYATRANVTGGFSKLLAYAERTYTHLSSIYTFSDNCVSDGGLYANTGFTAIKELRPDYMYVKKGLRHHKFGYRLQRFRNDPELLWEEGLSERELAALNGLTRIWDAGKVKWEKTIH